MSGAGRTFSLRGKEGRHQQARRAQVQAGSDRMHSCSRQAGWLAGGRASECVQVCMTRAPYRLRTTQRSMPVRELAPGSATRLGLAAPYTCVQRATAASPSTQSGAPMGRGCCAPEKLGFRKGLPSPSGTHAACVRVGSSGCARWSLVTHAAVHQRARCGCDAAVPPPAGAPAWLRPASEPLP